MANDKVISREESRSFDRYLFDNDFFEIDVTRAVADEPVLAEAEAASGDATEGTPQDSAAPAAPAEKKLTKEDLAQAESDGYAAGLADGKTQAAEDFKQELQSHIAGFAASLKDLDTLRDELKTELSQKALRLLADMLPALLADASKKYPEALLHRTAEKLLDTLAEEKVLSVKTAPDTKEFLLKHIADAEGLKAKLKPEHFSERADLQVGDCIIEWETGGITINHDDILQQLSEVLLGAAQSPKKLSKEPKKATHAEETPHEEKPDLEEVHAQNAELPQDAAQTTEAPETLDAAPAGEEAPQDAEENTPPAPADKTDADSKS